MISKDPIVVLDFEKLMLSAYIKYPLSASFDTYI